jgi:AbrB family looped-hinge helix DNA binding protein
METTTMSSKYQVVIPTNVRKQLGAKPGLKFWVFYESGSVRLIPKVDIDSLFGTLKGIDPNIEREDEDRI